MSKERLERAAARTREAILIRRTPGAGWRGQLSSSALSTATAVLALVRLDPEHSGPLIRRGVAWLLDQQWASGGWGDTDRSLPNISTTLLAWAALGAVKASGVVAADSLAKAETQCEAWLAAELGLPLSPQALAKAILGRYGKDQTFSVPILMACAIGGRLGAAPECWNHVPQLPCQLAAFPRRFFAALNLRVVSYALPALIAIGQVRHFHRPSGPGRGLRSLTRNATLRLLEQIQPASGGYLEATPLTSFVTMALADAGYGDLPVAQKAKEFLHASIRNDGSWPIDSDLATWVTTLSVKALQHHDSAATARESWPQEVASLLVAQQYRQVHPFTQSAPGGWAWTELSGGVPDADDTSGALLALHALQPDDPAAAKAASQACQWLLDLQNRDGGMPTFCRGWGALPFDRSTGEITAHALEAWERWQQALPTTGRLERAVAKAWQYLARTQAEDGSWSPLWFGQELGRQEANPVYGTAVVLKHLLATSPSRKSQWQSLLAKAANFLEKEVAKPTWVWGIEETAVVLTALSRWPHTATECIVQLEEQLLRLTAEGQEFPAAPIGLYFARLWYHEELYPFVWSLEGFTEALRRRSMMATPSPTSEIGSAMISSNPRLSSSLKQ